MPGIAVSVVNSYDAASENVPVSFVKSVDLPTEGNPTSPTRVSPTLFTSKPSPVPPPDFEPASVISRRSLAILAFSRHRCFMVALFFCVRAYSVSSSLIFAMAVDMVARLCLSVASGWRQSLAR